MSSGWCRMKNAGLHMRERKREKCERGEGRQHGRESEEEHAALTASVRDLTRKLLFALQQVWMMQEPPGRLVDEGRVFEEDTEHESAKHR